MAATQFTDDAYNKELKGQEAGTGTLIGNWYEEGVQRSGTGEGRTHTQRHIRRSGLLKDFTRMPSDGTRVQDDTFGRCHGHRKYDLAHKTSLEYGPPAKPHVTALNNEPRMAPKKGTGVRLAADEAEYYAFAQECAAAEEDHQDELREARSWETAGHFPVPAIDNTSTRHARLNCRRELLQGPELSDAEVHARLGVDFAKLEPFTTQEAVTAHTEMAANKETRTALRASALSHGFRKDFSNSDTRGWRDEQKDVALPQTQTDVFPDAHKPLGYGLSDLKLAILAKWTAAHGPQAVPQLREALRARGDGSWVSVADLREVLAVDGGFEAAIATYVKQMCTMDKSRAQVAKVIESLRPSVPNARLALALAKWPSLDEAWAEAEGIPFSKYHFVEHVSDLSAGQTDAEFEAKWG